MKKIREQLFCSSEHHELYLQEQTKLAFDRLVSYPALIRPDASCNGTELAAPEPADFAGVFA